MSKPTNPNFSLTLFLKLPERIHLYQDLIRLHLCPLAFRVADFSCVLQLKSKSLNLHEQLESHWKNFGVLNVSMDALVFDFSHLTLASFSIQPDPK